ncbi:hypothetical protein Tco_0365408 [Tanacetum coccineum]
MVNNWRGSNMVLTALMALKKLPLSEAPVRRWDRTQTKYETVRILLLATLRTLKFLEEPPGLILQVVGRNSMQRELQETPQSFNAVLEALS